MTNKIDKDSFLYLWLFSPTTSWWHFIVRVSSLLMILVGLQAFATVIIGILATVIPTSAIIYTGWYAVAYHSLSFLYLLIGTVILAILLPLSQVAFVNQKEERLINNLLIGGAMIYILVAFSQPFILLLSPPSSTIITALLWKVFKIIPTAGYLVYLLIKRKDLETIVQDAGISIQRGLYVEEYMALLAHQLPVPGVLVNNSIDYEVCCFEDVNNSFIQTTGWTREVLISKPFKEFIVDKDQVTTSQAYGLDKTLDIWEADGTFVNAYYTGPNRTDTDVVYLKWFSPHNTSGGSAWSYCLDITKEVKQTEQIVKRRNRELSAEAAKNLLEKYT